MQCPPGTERNPTFIMPIDSESLFELVCSPVLISYIQSTSHNFWKYFDKIWNAELFWPKNERYVQKENRAKKDNVDKVEIH